MNDTLMETGTRYEHWNELLDIFRQGVAVVDGMTHAGTSDREVRTKLAGAIEVIEKRLNHAAGLNSNSVPDWLMREAFSGEDPREEHVAISADV